MQCGVTGGAVDAATVTAHGLTHLPPVYDGAAAAASRRLYERYSRTSSVPRISQALATVRYR